MAKIGSEKRWLVICLLIALAGVASSGFVGINAYEKGQEIGKAEGRIEAKHETFTKIHDGIWRDVERCKQQYKEPAAQIQHCEPIAMEAIRVFSLHQFGHTIASY